MSRVIIVRPFEIGLDFFLEIAPERAHLPVLWAVKIDPLSQVQF
jgi:hypothetical protein